MEIHLLNIQIEIINTKAIKIITTLYVTNSKITSISLTYVLRHVIRRHLLNVRTID